MPSTVQPTDCAVPKVSLTTPDRFLDMDLGRMILAAPKISSMVMLPLCLMFLTFLVTWRFLKSLDDQCGSTRYHIHFSLTVLDSQSDGNFQAFPVLGGLGDVITNLFGRQTQRTNLGG